jgi:hypothetical protein
MWNKLREMIAGVAEHQGLEVPGLPVDASAVTDAVTGATDSLGAVGETAGGLAADATDAAGGTLDSVTDVTSP